VAEYAEIIERLKCYLEFTKDWIHHLETRIAYYSGQLWKTNEFQKREREGSSNVPWSVLDRFTQITFSIFSFALLGIGINTLATYLMGSGYIVFLEKPVLAYILSAVNIGVAVILKIGSAWCNNDSSKRRYFLCLWVAGLLSGLTWLGSFSILFPNIGIEGIEGIIAGLSSETSAFKGALERIFVASQLVAEVCIAAALWIYLERLSLKHGPLFTVEKNPVYQLYFNNLSDLNKKLLKAADKEGAIGGCLKKIEAKKYVLLTSAVSALSAKQRSMAEKIYNLDGESLNL
jgi:hypothetical protein